MPSPFDEPRAAYIHVPFCAHRCGYCDFTLVARREDLIDGYLRGMELELNRLEAPRQVDTLFLGGGTPTHLPAAELARLLDLVRRWFHLAPGYEFSVEANPSGLGADKIALLAEHGVNRISLGVQSFDADVLHKLERDHQAPQIAETVGLLQERFDNISLDLIFGVPGQSLELWEDTLAQALALGTAHLSTYGLTYEKGTAFWSRRAKQQLIPVDEGQELEMYAVAIDTLADAGLNQYELSNFARPGFECRHNGVYWAGLPYYGFGPGAARYLQGRRETNHRSVTTWVKRVLEGASPIGDAEQLTPEDRARETVVLGLRRSAGVQRAAFREQTGFELDALCQPAIARSVSRGLIADSGDRIQLTRAGRFVADSVIVEFL